MVPLHIAANEGHQEVIEILLSANAPTNPRSLLDDVPADYAKRNGHLECERILRKIILPNLIKY
jgi:ankyrin repeat protein